jgi:NADH-quinone oxidoreductase subunit K
MVAPGDGKKLREGVAMVEYELHLLHNYLIVGALLFGIGTIGFLARRNMIVMFLCVEMMLQGVSLSLVAWGRYHGNWGGQVLVIFILAVAACEAGIALAMFLMLYRRSGNLDMIFWQSLREENQSETVDVEIPEPDEADHQWPILTPAGIEPDHDTEKPLHRSHV